ncbi:MAG: hypothetical protein LH473_12600 [Chitinophagales bacterium]|nr:hypothetical protein [Chitinophagales bacterium]
MDKKEQEMYHAVWAKYLPVITLKVKQVIRTGEPAHIGMYQFEFHKSGKKRKIGHQFDLELKFGRVLTDISKSAVALELNAVIKEDTTIRPLVNAGHFCFSLDSSFVFTIEKKTIEE